eukprot:scaffold43898_cov31-Attheya_sp.AAC.1
MAITNDKQKQKQHDNEDGSRLRCTCGPHASVDLTRAFSLESSSPPCASLLREQLWDACRRQGCFHATINVSQLERMERNSSNNTPERLSSLAGSVPSIHDDIHDLMSVCCPHNTTNDGATYRGRTAESGAAGRTHSAAEPKQSWEMKRFTCQCQTIPNSREQGSSSGVTVTVPEDESWPLARRKLVDWTRDLHQVATVIMELLFLETTVPPPTQPQPPPSINDDNDTGSSQNNVWLEPQPCAAAATSKKIHSLSLLNDESMTNNKPRTTCCCNVDLLRAFCYDAVELDAEDDDDNPTKDDDARLLGSSPHTDWGTLTV